MKPDVLLGLSAVGGLFSKEVPRKDSYCSLMKALSCFLLDYYINV